MQGNQPPPFGRGWGRVFNKIMKKTFILLACIAGLRGACSQKQTVVEAPTTTLDVEALMEEALAGESWIRVKNGGTNET